MNELDPRHDTGAGPLDGRVPTRIYDGGELAYGGSTGLLERKPAIRYGLIGLLIVAILVSALPLRAHFSSPDAYQTTIQTLDEKKSNVTVMMAVAMGASAGITLIPDDTGTPIAEKLADVAGDLAIVLGALYLEKYLLTIFGTTAFLILVPVACLAMILWLTSIPETIMDQANRLVEGFAVMIVTSCVIPILVLAFFLWLANLFLGIDIQVPMQRIAHPRTMRRRPHAHMSDISPADRP